MTFIELLSHHDVDKILRAYIKNYQDRPDQKACTLQYAGEILATNVTTSDQDNLRFFAHITKKNNLYMAKEKDFELVSNPCAESAASKKQGKQTMVPLLGWDQINFLKVLVVRFLRLYVDFEYKHDSELTLSLEKLLKAISDEIVVAANAFRILNQYKTTIKKLNEEPNKLKIFFSHFINSLSQILSDDACSEICFPCGIPKHAMYLIFRRYYNKFLIRMDNLGAGSRYHKEENIQDAEKKTTTSVQPKFIAELSLTQLNQGESKDNLIAYLTMICQARFSPDMSAAAVILELYNRRDNFKLPPVNGKENDFPFTAIQNLPDCVTANYCDVQMSYRLDRIGTVYTTGAQKQVVNNLADWLLRKAVYVEALPEVDKTLHQSFSADAVSTYGLDEESSYDTLSDIAEVRQGEHNLQYPKKRIDNPTLILATSTQPMFDEDFFVTKSVAAAELIPIKFALPEIHISKVYPRQNLQEEITTKFKKKDILVINGLLGVGKSVLINCYAQTVAEQKICIWLDFDTGLYAQLLTFVTAVDSNFRETKEQKVIESFFKYINEYANKLHKDILMVIDGVNQIDTFLCTILSYAHSLESIKFVLTGQQHVINKDILNSELEEDLVDSVEIPDFIKERLDYQSDIGCNVSTFLPAISMINAAESLLYTYAECKQIFEYNKSRQNKDLTQSISCPYDTSKDDLNAAYLTIVSGISDQEYLKITKQCAYLYGNSIPLDLLKNISGKNEEELTFLIKKNSAFQLLIYDHNKKRFQQHELIQGIIRDTLLLDEKQLILEDLILASVNTVRLKLNKIDQRSSLHTDNVVPSIKKLIGHAVNYWKKYKVLDEKTKASFVELFGLIIAYSPANFSYEDFTFFENYLSVFNLEQDQVHLARVYTAIALFFDRNKKCEYAKIYFRKARDIGSNISQIRKFSNNIIDISFAKTYCKQGCYSAAIAICKQLLDDMGSVDEIKKNDKLLVSYIDILIIMGKSESGLDNPEKAILTLSDALVNFKADAENYNKAAKFTAKNLLLKVDVNTLQYIECCQALAVAYIRKYVKNPIVDSSTVKTSTIQYNECSLEVALKFIDRSLEVGEQIFGNKFHPKLIKSHDYQGVVFTLLGLQDPTKYTKAIDKHTETIQLNSDSFNVTISMAHRAFAKYARGICEQAKEKQSNNKLENKFLLEAKDDYEQCLKKAVPDHRAIFVFIGLYKTWFALGKYKKAIIALQQAYKHAQLHYSVDLELSIKHYVNPNICWKTIWEGIKDRPAKLGQMKEILSLISKLYGQDHLEYAEALFYFANQQETKAKIDNSTRVEWYYLRLQEILTKLKGRDYHNLKPIEEKLLFSPEPRRIPDNLYDEVSEKFNPHSPRVIQEQLNPLWIGQFNRAKTNKSDNSAIVRAVLQEKVPWVEVVNDNINEIDFVKSFMQGHTAVGDDNIILWITPETLSAELTLLAMKLDSKVIQHGHPGFDQEFVKANHKNYRCMVMLDGFDDFIEPRKYFDPEKNPNIKGIVFYRKKPYCEIKNLKEDKRIPVTKSNGLGSATIMPTDDVAKKLIRLVAFFNASVVGKSFVEAVLCRYGKTETEIKDLLDKLCELKVIQPQYDNAYWFSLELTYQARKKLSLAPDERKILTNVLAAIMEEDFDSYNLSDKHDYTQYVLELIEFYYNKLNNKQVSNTEYSLEEIRDVIKAGIYVCELYLALGLIDIASNKLEKLLVLYNSIHENALKALQINLDNLKLKIDLSKVVGNRNPIVQTETLSLQIVDKRFFKIENMYLQLCHRLNKFTDWEKIKNDLNEMIDLFVDNKLLSEWTLDDDSFDVATDGSITEDDSGNVYFDAIGSVEINDEMDCYYDAVSGDESVMVSKKNLDKSFNVELTNREKLLLGQLHMLKAAAIIKCCLGEKDKNIQDAINAIHLAIENFPAGSIYHVYALQQLAEIYIYSCSKGYFLAKQYLAKAEEKLVEFSTVDNYRMALIIKSTKARNLYLKIALEKKAANSREDMINDALRFDREYRHINLPSTYDLVPLSERDEIEEVFRAAKGLDVDNVSQEETMHNYVSDFKQCFEQDFKVRKNQKIVIYGHLSPYKTDRARYYSNILVVHGESKKYLHWRFTAGNEIEFAHELSELAKRLYIKVQRGGSENDKEYIEKIWPHILEKLKYHDRVLFVYDEVDLDIVQPCLNKIDRTSISNFHEIYVPSINTNLDLFNVGYEKINADDFRDNQVGSLTKITSLFLQDIKFTGLILFVALINSEKISAQLLHQYAKNTNANLDDALKELDGILFLMPTYQNKVSYAIDRFFQNEIIKLYTSNIEKVKARIIEPMIDVLIINLETSDAADLYTTVCHGVKFLNNVNSHDLPCSVDVQAKLDILSLKLGLYFCDFKDHEMSIKYLRAYIRVKVTHESENFGLYIRSCIKLAMSCTRRSNYDEAIGLCNEIEKYQLEGDLKTEFNIAYIYIHRVAGKIDLAFARMEAEFKPEVETALEQKPKTLSELCDVKAACYFYKGRLDDTKNYLDKALEYQDASDCLRETDIKSWLATYYYIVQDYSEAKKAIKCAIEIVKRTYNKSHTNLAMHYKNYANILIAMKEYARAGKYLERALSIATSAYDVNNFRLLEIYLSRIYLNYLNLADRKNNEKQQEILFNQIQSDMDVAREMAVSICRKRAPSDVVTKLEERLNKMNINVKYRYDLAFDFFDIMAECREIIYGKAHPYVKLMDTWRDNICDALDICMQFGQITQRIFKESVLEYEKSTDSNPSSLTNSYADIGSTILAPKA